MKKRFLSLTLILCMILSFMPTTVFAADDEYLDVGNKTFEGVTTTTKYTFGSGTATFDPSNSTLTLDKVTITSSQSNAAAINGNISNLKIVLKGENKITISNDSMAAMLFSKSTKISGDSNSKLIIESTGKNNKGIFSYDALSISGTNITIVDKTTNADSKGYMIGIWTTSGNLSMNNVKYTATDVLCAIDSSGPCTLNNVTFDVNCTLSKNYDATNPETYAIGVHTTSRSNTLENCSGSITAQYPLYINGATKLNNCNNLTLTSNNYSAAYLTGDLTISGGRLSFKSTGSEGSGFMLSGSSKLVFEKNTNVTVDVGNAGILANGNNSSVEISGGTVNTTAVAGLALNTPNSKFTLMSGKLDMKTKSGAKTIGIQSFGTINVTGGSLITTGLTNAIGNYGGKTVSFSGGTHTFGVADGGIGYVDNGAANTLSISNNANVTFTGGKDNIRLNGRLDLSGGTLNAVSASYCGVFMVTNSVANLTGGTLNVNNTLYGIMMNGNGGLKFAGTDAKLIGSKAGWATTSNSAGYNVTGGSVVFQGGEYAAGTIYSSSLPEGYCVYAGSSESGASFVASPTSGTFSGNTYVLIRAARSFNLTVKSVYYNDSGLDLPNDSSPATYTHTEGSNFSYTAPDPYEGFHFDHWELNKTNVGTAKTYTGTMPSGDATLSAVYVQCSGGTATCTAKAICSTCNKEYGTIKPHDYTEKAETEEACESAPSCSNYGRYYYSCSMCHKVEGDVNHTFTGNTLNMDNHAGCNQLQVLVMTYGDISDTTIQLIKDGETEPTGEYTAKNIISKANFTIYHLQDNTTYTMKVMKKNHVTREYTIQVVASNMTQDAEIHLLGDVNGDGKVNTKDWAMLYDHVNETSKLSDYLFACGDVNGDGKLNTKDWAMMYDHITETKPLW